MADRVLDRLEIRHGTKERFDSLPEKSEDTLYFIEDSTLPAETMANIPEEEGHYVLFLNKISDTQSSVSWVEDQSEEALEAASNALDAVDTLSGQVQYKDKMQVVDELPENPDADTFYFIKE